MGGRGGGGGEGEWPTIKIYLTTIYFFDGITERIYNRTASVGEHDSTAYFTVDDWGNKHYYIADGSYKIEGSGYYARYVIVPIKATFASTSLQQQAAGQYYRAERTFLARLGTWANRDYPSWALKE